MINKFKNIYKLGTEIVSQQNEMLKKGINKIKDRIISFHKSQIRPINRGKYHKTIECGQRLNVNLIGKKILMVTNCTTENISDTKQVSISIEKHKELTGRYPTEYGYDKGGHSPGNHQLLKAKGIHDGIQYRGKRPKGEIPIKGFNQKRIYKERALIEGKIGVMKRCFGLGKNTYKTANGLLKAIMGVISMNYRNNINI